jgi:hypothetical protein
MFEPTREEVTRGKRKMHNEKLHKLHFSPNIIGMIKAGNIAHMGAMRIHTKF